MSTEQTFGIGTTIIVGIQMLFVAFGALVLVPILTGLDPSVALFTAGVGTLVFQLVTGASIPVFLASSFAFIAPIIYGVETWGVAKTMSGLFAAGLVYMFLSVLVAWKGLEIIHRILPPVVVGPVIMIIGLSLAPVGVNLALGKTGDGAVVLIPQDVAVTVASISLVATVLCTFLGQGLFKLIPILVGVVAGYLASIVFDLVDFSLVSTAPTFAVPNFVFPEFSIEAILFIVPVAIAPAIEHVGDVLAISNVTGKDYLRKPGLHRSLLGDGLATSIASFLGGPPNTTYSEVTGAVTLTKMFQPLVMTFAAVFAIIFAFSGTLNAVLSSIPTPVMGGILILLFGAIAAVGMNSLVKSRTDLTIPRNLVIVSIILVFGIGGMSIEIGDVRLGGIGLAAIAGVVLNLIIPRSKGA